MIQPGKLHLGRYQRYLWEDPGLTVVLGSFSEISLGKQAYEERHGIKPAEEAASRQLEQLMSVSALAAVSRAEAESWGWTVTLPGSERGFFCGVEPEGMICGRVRRASEDKAAVLLQRQKAAGLLVESHYEPLSDDPVQAISRYFAQVEQVQTRIVLGEGRSGVLIQALPDGDYSKAEHIPDDELLTMLRRMADEGELKPVYEMVLFYECRCNDEMILEMITSLPDGQRRELWGSESSLTVECPRCGREYTIQRA